MTDKEALNAKIERTAEEAARDLIDAYPESYPDGLNIPQFTMVLKDEVMTRLREMMDAYGWTEGHEDRYVSAFDNAKISFNEDSDIWEFMADYIENHSN